VYQGAKPKVYIAATTWTATMFVCIKRSKRDLFWGLHNKKGAWYFWGNKSSTTKVQQGAKPGVHIERIEQTAVTVDG